MDRRRHSRVFHEGESVGHPPWRDRLDFNLPSEITRRTDRFQLIEPGKLSVVDGIKLTFDANAAFAQVEHHWGKPRSSNDNRICFDGSANAQVLSAPQTQGVERKASFQRSEYKNEMHLLETSRCGESSRIARGRVRRPSRGGGLFHVEGNLSKGPLSGSLATQRPTMVSPSTPAAVISPPSLMERRAICTLKGASCYLASSRRPTMPQNFEPTAVSRARRSSAPAGGLFALMHLDEAPARPRFGQRPTV
jgi:hypothetical protein